jgi:subtilisin-like proprotein convertase family protein
MERRLRALCVAVAGVLLAFATARGSEAAISKAHPALLRAMASGQSEIRVIVGVKDGTTPARILRERPDPAGEPDRRLQRLNVQQRVAAETATEQFRSPRFYGSFSLMAGIASAAGIESLARRSDVAWLALDGEKRLLDTPGSEAPQSLIHSDEANALGFTGKGQTVAILDTGTDQSVPELGGGSFPNAKVIGGFNVTEPNAAPSDCEGHGTSVAAIVASPRGVAPDAKIVSVKVFPGCQGFTYDSLILSGLDFAISNQAAFGIGALNLSLGASPTGDDSDLGFCDRIQPQFADPINAATAAGMVVTVAAGNSATTNQISSPACLSSAVSVGAVYPLASSGVDWGICSDVAIVPGTPTCFSNSNTNLTLLAPGAFWSVPTAGGQTISFSGTSAAAPAVAGSVALVRQARPGVSPSTTVSLLRATGRPITDPRNGVVTPLVDDLAAVQFAPVTFGNLEAAPIPIPDGTGSATATTNVSGFTGFLSSVEVWVEIDHADPGQLRLTLTGPDGASVILHDQTGQIERPINVVFGRTESSLFPLTAFQGRQGNGTWTLTVQDLVPGVSGRILHFSVTLIAGAPQPPIEAIPLFADGLVIPIAARTHGTKFFQTDVRLYNPSLDPKEFDLYFVGTAQTGATASKTSHTIGSGQVLAVNDLVLSEFGQSDSFGQLTIVSNDPTFHNFLAASHTYTHNDSGTFGFSAPGFKTTSGLVLGGGTATTNGLAKTPTLHTNVGFTETSGFPVTVKIDVRNGLGVLIGSTSRTTQPYTTYVITDILLDRGIPSMNNFRVDFTVTSPTGRAIPFAATVDKVTGDSVFHAPLMPALTTDDIIVAQAAHVSGANGDFFQTMLDITNLDTKNATVTVSLLPLFIPPGATMARTYIISPGQTLEFPDVLSTEFDLDDPVAAGLRIHPAAAARLAVSSRTSVAKFGGTFGFSIDGVRASSALAPGGTATAILLDHSNAAAGSRTNFGFVEVAGHDVQVLVTAIDGDTGAAIGGNSYLVLANTAFQTSASDVLGAGVAASNFYLQFSIVGGTGKIVAYAAGVDNMSGDVTYIAAQ